jgi:cytochrome c oxidase cbb3-type subunit 3
MNLGAVCAAVIALSVAGCKQGQQQGGATTAQGGNVAGGDTAGGAVSGGFVTESPTSNKNPAVTSTEITHKFTGNVEEANAGRTLFLTRNCVGCHGGLAGGAMGPSLRDTVWKYGGTDQGISASIRDGRPGGMPAWGHASSVGQENTLSAQQIQQLVTYIHSMRTEAEPTFFFWSERQQAAPQGSGTGTP